MLSRARHLLPVVLPDAVALPVAVLLPGAVELVLPDTLVLLVLPGAVELVLPDTFVLLGAFCYLMLLHFLVV